MRKKKDESILLPPDRYWSDKLEINFYVEFARYVKLCGKYNQKDFGTLDGAYFISYGDWKTYMQDKISKLDLSDKEEFCHYLQNKERMNSLTNNLNVTLLIPFFITIYAPFLMNVIFNIFSENALLKNKYYLVAAFVTIIITFSLFISTLIKVINTFRHDEYSKFFYQDLRGMVTNELTCRKL